MVTLYPSIFFSILLEANETRLLAGFTATAQLRLQLLEERN